MSDINLKIMRRIFISSLLVLCLSTFSFCQIEQKMKDEGVVTGMIFKNGEKTQGYIKKKGIVYERGTGFPAPWQFQSGIKFIPKDVFENNKKIKRKDYDKYGPKDCDSFIYDSVTYESVTYSDMSAVSMQMLPRRIFMKKVLDDKISLFHYFSSPPPIILGGSGDLGPLYINCATIHWVYRIGKDGKLKLANDMNINKELSDCPMVVEKKEKGEYKVVGHEGNRPGLSKLINNAVFREEVRLMAIRDYNENCK